MTKNSAGSAGLFGTARSRRSTAIALAIALVVALPTVGSAQDSPKSYKRFYLAVGGFLLVGIPAYVFTSNNNTLESGCSSQGCVGLVAGILGAGIGFLVGMEMDKSYSRRMAAGPSLDYTFRDIPLDLVPDRMTYFPGGAAVVGSSGARIIREDGSIHARGSGVRGIEDVAVIPSLDLLVLSTYSNLISFSVEDDSVQGQVIDERGGGVIEAFQSRLAVAGLDSLRLLGIRRNGDDYDVETVAGFEKPDYVTDITFPGYGRVGWVLTEDRLAAYSADLEKVGEIVLPAAGRTVRGHGNRLAIAAGTNGVYVLDASDPATPRVVQQYTGVRFAYAADLEGDRLYVAAGTEGVAVVDVSGDQPRVIGVARHTEFATDVRVSGVGKAWILDRDGQLVQIVDFGVTNAADDADDRR
jgi:hypothetical protein